MEILKILEDKTDSALKRRYKREIINIAKKIVDAVRTKIGVFSSGKNGCILVILSNDHQLCWAKEKSGCHGKVCWTTSEVIHGYRRQMMLDCWLYHVYLASYQILRKNDGWVYWKRTNSRSIYVRSHSDVYNSGSLFRLSLNIADLGFEKHRGRRRWKKNGCNHLQLKPQYGSNYCSRRRRFFCYFCAESLRSRSTWVRE